MQSAAATGAPFLATLLRAAPSDQLSECSAAARNILYSFLYPYNLMRSLCQAPEAMPLKKSIWQRVMVRPSGLASTVEALQACLENDDNRLKDEFEVGNAMSLYPEVRPGNEGGLLFPDWPAWVASDSLQRFAMEGLGPALPSSQSPAPLQRVRPPSHDITSFVWFLSAAAKEGRLSDARMSALLAHECVLAPLRDVAAGRIDVDSKSAFTVLSEVFWTQLDLDFCPGSGISTLGGGPEAHVAAQGVMMAALRQGTVLLQLHALPHPRRRRAVLLARKGGFLQV